MNKEVKEKNNKVGYIIIIILLILVVLGLVGYIIYDNQFKENNKCDDTIESVKEEAKTYELTYSKATEYMEKIQVYNNIFHENYLISNKKEITNDEYLTFAYRMLLGKETITVENIEKVLHEYFGKNIKFEHDNIKCFAGEEVYEYSKENGYTEKEHYGHGGPGALKTEIFYVSSEVRGNKVKFVTKNVYEDICGEICGPNKAYYASVDDAKSQTNPILKAAEYQESVEIAQYNKEFILSKVPETTYNFIIEDNGNYYLDSVNISK